MVGINLNFAMISEVIISDIARDLTSSARFVTLIHNEALR
jgi:hypothetical protein